ncbi:hypothetical protein GQ44DRAFT_92179 [Phaeosphaeriaceae sp. PMI808]|nr:hypothetical protein GQ44DRAFT_92179 [Phaeosphaeriaceae sp. PMI808]
MFSKTSILASLLAIAPMPASAHMFMRKPVPYGNPDNGPLEASGANFPCKGVAYTGGKNDWVVGSKQRIEMGGTAVHGGGSCQVSVTTDKAPTKSSKWKVIHSVHGGCPAPPKEGGNYAEGSPPASLGFDFTVPTEVPNGELAMAWTWFNRIGAREMYMVCAPVTVTGGASDQALFNALPDMAIANIASQGTCKTKEGSDYLFENPGKYITVGEKGLGPLIPLCNSGGGGGGGSGGTPPAAPPTVPPAPPAPANPGAPAGPSQAPANPPAAPTVIPSADNKLTSTLRTIITVTAPSTPQPSAPPGSSALASSKPPAGAPSSPAQVSPSPPGAPAAPSNTPAGPSQPPAAPAPGGSTGGQTCSPDGAIVCSGDGKQFGLCNWGKAVMQPVAAGTTCVGGKIAKRDGFVTRIKTVYT